MVLEVLLGILSAVVSVLVIKRVYGPKEIAFWRMGLIIAAMVYVILAFIGQGWNFLGLDLLGVLAYGVFACLSKTQAKWWIAVGWGLHGLWDIFIHPNGHPGYVPEWYPGVCLGFDLFLAAYLGWIILNK